MTNVEEIEKAIAGLSPEEFSRLKEFVDELNERQFDQRIERDASTGKLDWLADEALADHKAGRSRRLR
ncbi:MAG: hypothetical protein ACREC3_17655 [Methyloceanibacter sp.]